MTTQSELGTTKGTLAELLDLIAALGNIPPERIRMNPPPGTATEADVIAEREGPDRRLCELVDGILVEKPMSTPESFIAIEIAFQIKLYIRPRNLGAVYGEGGMLRLDKGLIRIPDVTYVPWDKVPGRKIDFEKPVTEMAPDLAVEVLSKTNTPEEIEQKLKEYFFHGTRLAWVIDPRRRTAKVYTSPDMYTQIETGGTLEADPVLPGFAISLSELFATSSG